MTKCSDDCPMADMPYQCPFKKYETPVVDGEIGEITVRCIYEDVFDFNAGRIAREK